MFSTSGWYQGHQCQQQQNGAKYQQSKGQVITIVGDKINNEKHSQGKATDELYYYWKDL